ncbi:amino acid ABC transporter permease [Brevibacillus sp. WF146]|uniref:amino acid ABC transporter permease n=1 Tax=Brevibacillus sp. WF146 TaxID=319501 RepID=UPI0007ECC941|nr:amino acid ABC transporter permease [Brevibacillus sp. WF146]UYZ12624.1 amino acid ABC transporter permease [Brevibacillus sp. WF146]
MESLDFSVLAEWENIRLLLQALVYTVLYTCAGFILSLFIGLLIAFGQMSKVKAIRFISLAYLSWFRGTPLLVQLFLLYYGLPIIFKVDTVAWISGVIALGMYSGSYTSQVIRGAIQSIDKGQMEAGRSLGFSYAQTMRKIIVPQAVIRMLAPLTNEFISLTKNSSLLSTITVVELFRQANIMIADTYKTMEFLFAVAILYYLLNNVIGYLGLMLEKRFHTGDDLR